MCRRPCPPPGRNCPGSIHRFQENRPGLYTRLILSGKLYDHLAEIDSTCQERMSRMVPQMAAAEGINEALKARDPMAWVGYMNNIHQRAEETILAELIYA
ncbi:MAG: TnpV protein [Clostridia bacterium]|nr:TnpV protein [Clostridia bacterium]